MSAPDSQEKILIVTEDSGLRNLLTQWLHQEGYDVWAVSNSRQARPVLAEGGIELVLLDLDVAEAAEGPLASWLQSAAADTTILALASAGSEQLVDAYRDLLSDFIRKPLRVSVLLKRMTNVLDRRRLLAQNEALIAQLREHERILESEVQRATRELRAIVEQQIAERSRSLAILNALTDCVMQCSLDGRVEFMNRPAERLFGFTTDQAWGRTWWEVARASQDAGLVIASIMAGASVEGLECEVRTQSGAKLPVRLTTSAFQDAEGRPLAVVVALRDISHEHELERVKVEFLTAASHELRTPLTSIKGYVELLLSGSMGELDESQRNCLKAVERNSARLADLLQKILDLARLESHAFQLQLEPTDARLLLSGSVKAVRGQAQDQGIKLLVEAPAEPLVLTSDEKRLKQVVHELLKNALQCTGSGGEVRASVGLVEGGVEISVSDTGTGMTPDQQQRIFEKFHKLDPARPTKMPGAGLGLPLAKAIVERLGGAIRVKSALGEGTTFTLFLPQHLVP